MTIENPVGHVRLSSGGGKASGYRRFGGRAGIDAFTDLRWITLQTMPRHCPF